MYSNQVRGGSVSIYVTINGAKTKSIIYDGASHSVVVQESAFRVVLCNTTNQPHEFVLSVDGLSVIDGQKITEESGGYVVAPVSSLEVVGFWRGGKRFAEFYFADANNGYATQMDKETRYAGMIKCNVYKKRPEYNEPPSSDLLRKAEMRTTLARYKGGVAMISTGRSFGSFEGIREPENLAIGYGREIEDDVAEVTFLRYFKPVARLSLEYKTLDQVVKMLTPEDY